MMMHQASTLATTLQKVSLWRLFSLLDASVGCELGITVGEEEGILEGLALVFSLLLEGEELGETDGVTAGVEEELL